MADRTSIEWTDATVNFWWGCTKVGPGCDHCYAETFDKRVGGAHWGQGAPRRKIKSAVSLIRRLNADAESFVRESGRRRRVFVQSMSDIFDLETPLHWFAEAWGEIEAADNLDIQLVTKRLSTVDKRLLAIDRFPFVGWPQHVGLIATIVNQQEADRDLERMLLLKQFRDIPWVGVSVEPILGPIDMSRWLDRIDWVIVGGESGPNARPAHPDWVRRVRDQCAAAGVPFLFKQWGACLPAEWEIGDTGPSSMGWVYEPDPSCWAGDYDDLPRAHRVEAHGREFARTAQKFTGCRTLDGVMHDAFPEARP